MHFAKLNYRQMQFVERMQNICLAKISTYTVCVMPDLSTFPHAATHCSLFSIIQ